MGDRPIFFKVYPVTILVGKGDLVIETAVHNAFEAGEGNVLSFKCDSLEGRLWLDMLRGAFVRIRFHEHDEAFFSGFLTRNSTDTFEIHSAHYMVLQ